MLASVAPAQGRIAMWRTCSARPCPLRWDAVAATIFTDPQIATVGLSEQRQAETGIQVEVDTLPLATNPRAKMSNRPDGFVKLLARPGSGTIAGEAVVASYASDLIAPIAEAWLQPAHGQPARPGVPDLPVVRRVDPGVRPPPRRAGPGFLPVLGRRTLSTGPCGGRDGIAQ